MTFNVPYVSSAPISRFDPRAVTHDSGTLAVALNGDANEDKIDKLLKPYGLAALRAQPFLPAIVVTAAEYRDVDKEAATYRDVDGRAPEYAYREVFVTVFARRIARTGATTEPLWVYVASLVNNKERQDFYRKTWGIETELAKIDFEEVQRPRQNDKAYVFVTSTEGRSPSCDRLELSQEAGVPGPPTFSLSAAALVENGDESTFRSFRFHMLECDMQTRPIDQGEKKKKDAVSFDPDSLLGKILKDFEFVPRYWSIQRGVVSETFAPVPA